MSPRYRALFSSLRAAGARLTESGPAPSDAVAALEARAGSTLPPDYVEFLREVGAVRIETELPGMPADLRFLGHAPGDEHLDVTLAIDELAAECARWDRPPVRAVPVLVYGVQAGLRGAPGSECMALYEGQAHRFRRGELEPHGSFDELVRAEVDELEAMLAALAERRRVTRSALAGLCALVPASLLAPTSDEDRLLLHRPDDGVEIALSVDSWRERYGKNDGLVLVATWSEPGLADDAARNAWNRTAWLARAGAEGCSARLHLAGLDPARALAALAHDARLPVPGLDASRPELDAIATRIAKAPPKSAEASMLDALFGRRGGAAPSGESPFRREGDVLVGRSTQGGSPKAVDVRIRVGPSGLVEIAHERPHAGSPRDAARIAARIDTGDPGGVRMWIADGAIVLAQVTTDAVVGSRAFTLLMNELEDAVARACG